MDKTSICILCGLVGIVCGLLGVMIGIDSCPEEDLSTEIYKSTLCNEFIATNNIPYNQELFLECYKLLSIVENIDEVKKC